MGDTGIIVFLFILLAAMVVMAVLLDMRRKKKRRDTLHRDGSTGDYVWIDYGGRERRAREDPSQKDGLWDQEAGGDGGDGGGGD